MGKQANRRVAIVGLRTVNEIVKGAPPSNIFEKSSVSWSGPETEGVTMRCGGGGIIHSGLIANQLT